MANMIEQVERIAKFPKQIFTDLGYRWHNGPAKVEANVVPRKREKISKALWRWMKHRAAVKPTIGRLKREHRMTGNLLKSTQSDRLCAMLAAVGMNFHKLLKFLGKFPITPFFAFCLS